MSVPGIKENQRVEIAVAGMEDIPVLKSIFFCDDRNLGQSFRQLCPWYGAIVDQEIRRQTCDRAKRPSSTLPEPVALSVVFGLVNIAATVFHADFPDAFGLVLEAGDWTFNLNDQHGRSVPRISAGITVFNRLDDERVHHFKRCRYNAGGHDIGNGLCSLSNIVINRKHGNYGFRKGENADGQFG